MIDVLEYAELKFGFKPKSKKPIYKANEFCKWARETGHDDLIYDLAREIGK